MATFLKLREKSRGLSEDICHRQNVADLYRNQEYAAAVKIQKWFRGVRCREYLRILSHSAVLIQRRWRGYLGRDVYREIVHKTVQDMEMKFYNAMAVRIQKRWRGYFVRKHVHNYYDRKKYLETLAIKNQHIRDEINEYCEQYDIEDKKRKHAEYERKMEYLARKNHFLLSTKQKPSIYNSPYVPYPQEMEMRLRVVQPLSPEESRSHSQRDKTMGCVDPEGDKHLVPPTKLPPLRPKQQGPFRSPSFVQQQRYKQLNPSLRVSTDFQSLDKARIAMKNEEQCNRVIDENFKPFTKTKTSYDPLLHTSSKYGHLPYGTKYFRENIATLNVSNKRMQAVVSPIPIFEKFRKTYTKGAVILQ